MYLSIDGWSSGLTFSACHVIPGHKKCGRLHGHTYAVHARVYGSQGRDKIILDFLHLKNVLRAISESLDHRVIMPKKSELMSVNVREDVEIRFARKRYILPKEDVVFLDIENASVEELTKFVLRKVEEMIDFPDNVTEIEIGVDEGKGQTAWIRKRCKTKHFG